jgi:hypothetical protein
VHEGSSEMNDRTFFRTSKQSKVQSVTIFLAGTADVKELSKNKLNHFKSAGEG